MPISTVEYKEPKKVRRHIPMRLYSVVANAVDAGVECGIRRSLKYSKHPLHTLHRKLNASIIELIDEHIKREVMNALSEILDFED